MSDYENPDAFGVRTAIVAHLALEDFEIVDFNNREFAKTSFALVRADGTVWIVTVQEGKLELAR